MGIRFRGQGLTIRKFALFLNDLFADPTEKPRQLGTLGPGSRCWSCTTWSATRGSGTTWPPGGPRWSSGSGTWPSTITGRQPHTSNQAVTDVCFSENWFRHDSWDCRPQNMYVQFSLLVAKDNWKEQKSICNLSQVLDSSSAFGGLSGWCRAVVDTRCRPGGAEHRQTMR